MDANTFNLQKLLWVMLQWMYCDVMFFSLQVYCGRYRSEHMVMHSFETGHKMVLSYADLSVWCYACDSYVHCGVSITVNILPLCILNCKYNSALPSIFQWACYCKVFSVWNPHRKENNWSPVQVKMLWSLHVTEYKLTSPMFYHLKFSCWLYGEK